jgi:hypothetical protein
LVNVATAANCVVAERYIRYTCDRGMWRYGITVIADVAIRCKLILACGVRINPARVLTGFAEECFMHYNSDTAAPHYVITDIVESYKVE